MVGRVVSVAIAPIAKDLSVVLIGKMELHEGRLLSLKHLYKTECRI